jgi:hypothetical protein
MTETPEKDTAGPPAPADPAAPPDAAPPEATPPPWLDLSLRWPAIFNIYDPRPLKIGLHDDLLAAGFAQAYLKRALTGYCRSHRYRRTLVEGATRIDLDGQPAGVVTRDQAALPRPRDPRPAPGKPGPPPRSRRPPPQPLPLPEEHIVKGRLELTLKFSELPKAIPGERDFTFGVDCEGTLIQISVRPRLWNRLTQAAQEYREWVATVTGKLGPATDKGFVLLEPGLQVFEKKPKEAATDPAPAAADEPALPPAVAAKVKAAAEDRGRAAVTAAAARRPKLTLPAKPSEPVGRRRW